MRWQQFRRGLAFGVFVCLFTWMAAPQAWADQKPATPNLTLNQAIDLAMAQSDTVKEASKQIDAAKSVRDNDASNVTYEPTGVVYQAVGQVNWTDLLKDDLAWEMSKPALTLQQDTVVLDAANKYWTVLSDQEKLTDAQAALDSAQRQVQSAQAGYRAGLLTMGDQSGAPGLLAAQANLTSAQSGLTGAQNDLASAYIAFNQAVGLDPVDRPVLTDSIDFQPLQVASLDSEVSRVLEASPTVKEAQENIDYQQQLQNFMFYAGQYVPYEARQIAVQSAELDATNIKKLYDLETRALYYEVKDLEEQYAKAGDAEKMDEENLRVTKLQVGAGLATVADQKLAEKNLADIKAARVSIAAEHAYLKLAFEKPWAMPSTASSASSSSSQS